MRASVATALVAMVVMGGSAGGTTVLMALALHPGVFRVGVNLYGVSGGQCPPSD